MKAILSLLITIGLIAGIHLYAGKPARAGTKHPTSRIERSGSAITKRNEEKMRSYAGQARAFVKQKNYNGAFCFLIDMSLPSGQPRFFVYDLINDSLTLSGLVAHGNCYQEWLEGRRYSNQVGSGCTSLGRYRIGIPYTGMWGYSYKLHGLDSTNNNAFERTVVLHGHRCVPAAAVDGEICQSLGCPTVAPAFLDQLKVLINASGKPLLLWIYQ